MPEPTSQQLVPPPDTAGHVAWHSLSLVHAPQVPPPPESDPPSMLPPLLEPPELLPLPEELPENPLPLLAASVAASAPVTGISLLESPEPHATKKAQTSV